MNQLFRIALTEAALTRGFLFSLPSPMPTAEYRSFTEVIPQSVGGNTRQGYKSVTLQWQQVTPTQMQPITDMVETAQGNNAQIYVTFPRGDSSNSGLDWVDASGYPQYPEIVVSEQQGLSGLVLVSYVLKINNLTIINEPSTAVT